jgi:hypothetical protein
MLEKNWKSKTGYEWRYEEKIKKVSVFYQGKTYYDF